MSTNPKFITKDEFDALARANRFIDGPWIETIGEGYGEMLSAYSGCIVAS